MRMKMQNGKREEERQACGKERDAEGDRERGKERERDRKERRGGREREISYDRPRLGARYRRCTLATHQTLVTRTICPPTPPFTYCLDGENLFTAHNTFLIAPGS